MQSNLNNSIENSKYISFEKNTLKFNVQKSLQKFALFSNPIKKDIKKKEREEDIKRFTKLVLSDNFECKIDDNILSSIVNNPQFLDDIMI